MAAQAIGALFVQLGLDSAAFQQGLKQTQSRLGKFGTQMATVGAGIAAAGTAAFAAFNTSASRLGDLEKQARVAGLSAQEFKVAALAVEQYGVSQEQLSDILKDVNDKMGDFAATGGGELKDFFEKIGPLVGVTAESFKGLNSSDALSLYITSLEKANVSQAEMTFYMEALANDATALIPAFRDGGAAIEEMTKKAEELGLAMDADLIRTAREAQGEMRLISEVLRTQFDQAVLKLGPSLSQLAKALMPVVDGIGALIRITLEWTDIAGKSSRQFVDAFLANMQNLPTSAGELIGRLDAALVAGFASVGQSCADAARRVVQSIIDGLKGLYEAGVQAVKDLAAGMAAEFVALKDRALGWGRDIADGLKAGLDAARDRVRGAVSGLADNVKGIFTDEMEIQSPSRVFMRFGGFISEGLQKGIEAGGSGVQGAMQDMAGGISDVFQNVLMDGASFADSMRSMLGNLFSGWSGNLFQSGFSGLMGMLKIPGFAAGGYHRGGLRIVGENGPELEATGAARYYSANRTRSMMSGDGAFTRVLVGVDPNNGSIVPYVDRRVEGGIAQSAPQIVNRSVGATRKSMGKSKRGWGI